MNKLKSKIAITLSVLVLSAMTAKAESPIVEAVLNGNPSLMALKTTADADVATQHAENHLAGPEAEMEYMFGKGAGNKWSVGISQGFDWPGVYRARSHAADAAARAGRLTYEARKQDIRYEARRLLVRYTFAVQRIELLEEMISDLDNIAASLDVALDHGLVTILDAKKARIELANLTIERDKIVAEKTAVRGLIQELAGHVLFWPDSDDDVTAGVLASVGPFLSLNEYVAVANQNDMYAQAARAEFDASTARANVMSASLAPSFSLGYRHAFEEGHHFNGFTISVGLPSWGIKSYKQAARVTKAAAMSEADAVQKATNARIFSDYRTAEALSERVASMRSNGLDGAYMALVNQAYKGGELSTMDYLREQSYYRQARLATLDLEEEYALVLTSLNRYNP